MLDLAEDPARNPLRIAAHRELVLVGEPALLFPAIPAEARHKQHIGAVIVQKPLAVAVVIERQLAGKDLCNFLDGRILAIEALVGLHLIIGLRLVGIALRRSP